MQDRECRIDPLKCLLTLTLHLVIIGIQTAIFAMVIGVILWGLYSILHIPETQGIFFTTFIVLSAVLLIIVFLWLISLDHTYVRKYRSDLKQGRILFLPWEIRIKKAYYRFTKWINKTILILLQNFLLSTSVIWFVIFINLIISDLSQEKLNNIIYYIVQSLNTLFSRDLITPILILTVAFIVLGQLNRARKTLIIEDVQDSKKKNDNNKNNGDKKEAPNYQLMLIEELNRIYRVYSDVNEQRPIKTSMAERCDITSASLRSGSLDTLLSDVTLSETEVGIGPVSVPAGFLLSMINKVLKGPRLLLSVDREDRTIRLSAVLVSPKNISWQVTRQMQEGQAQKVNTIHPPKNRPDEENGEQEETLCAEMASELAYRIFTGMTRGKTQRWESTRAFIQGLEKYRECLWSPKNQIKYLKKAEDKFVEALGYDEGYKFAWYNLGIVYSEMKRYDAAEKAFSHATEIDHSQWEPYYAKAVNALYQNIKDRKKAFCSKGDTTKYPPCRIQWIFYLIQGISQIATISKISFIGAQSRDKNKIIRSDSSAHHRDGAPSSNNLSKCQVIIANLDQAERALIKNRRKDVPEVFKVRGEAYLRAYNHSPVGDVFNQIQNNIHHFYSSFDQVVFDLQEATLSAWRQYQAYLASSPTTVSELAREETACRMMQESLSSLAYAYAHSNISYAECLISHAISIDPTCPEVYYTCGRIHLKGEEWDKAVKAFKMATEIAPDMTKYDLALTISEKCLMRAGGVRRGEEGSRQIIEMEKTDPENEREVVRKVTEEELVELNEIVEDLKGDDIDNEMKRIIYRSHREYCTDHQLKITSCGESKCGEKLYTTWLPYWKDPLTFQKHYDLACLHYRKKRYDLAIGFWTTTLPLRPQDPRISEYIGIASVKQVITSHPQNYDQILTGGKKNLENALLIYRHRIFKATEAQNNEEVFLKGTIRTYYWLGRLLSIRQKYVRAIEVFQVARQITEDVCKGNTSALNRGITYRLAWAYLRNRDYDLAEEEFRRAISPPKTDRGADRNTDLGRDLEDDINIKDIQFCSYLGMAYSHILRGISSGEVAKYLGNAAEKIKEGLKNKTYSHCYDYCLGLSRYTEYLSGPGNKKLLLIESITELTNGLKSRPTAGKFLALARACTTLGELDEVRTEEDTKKVQNIPARMPNLSRARECLILARKMDYYGRHTEEIETLQKRVERYIGIPTPEK